VIFWNGWFPFLFSNSQEKKSAQNNQQQNYPTSGGPIRIFSTVTFLRGTLDFEKLLREACEESNRLTWEVNSAQEQAKNRFAIHHVPAREQAEDDWESVAAMACPGIVRTYYRLLSHTPEEFGKAPLYEGSALDNLIFPERITKLIQRDRTVAEQPRLVS
jgi:hypothetical protein